jgi:4-amino-4-deoxy-L-arabinose transferase-like glycosyltransferase
LWGTTGAALSLFFFVLSPNILAHSALATTDIPATAFFFITAYFLYRIAAEGASWKKTVIASLFFAMGLASKHTTLLITPFIIAAFALSLRKTTFKKTVLLLAAFAVSSYLFVWVVYGFNFHSGSPGYPS